MTEQEKIVRMFLAIPGEPSFLPVFTDLIRQLKPEIQGRVSWIKNENFHITLKFLGEVRESKLNAIKEATQKVIQEVHPFSLFFDRLDFFPSLKRARVIILRGEASAPYEALIKGLNRELASIAPTEKEKEIIPHITLGRIKELDRPIRAEGIAAIPIKPLTLAVKEVRLYRSTLTPEGPVYDLLERFPLP